LPLLILRSFNDRKSSYININQIKYVIFMNKVLTSPSSFGQVDRQPFDLLTQNGFDIINNPFGRKLTEVEVIELAKDCIGIVV